MRHRGWLRLAGIAVVAALLVGFGRSVDWRSTAHALRTADPVLLALALLVNLLSLALKGGRWWIFLRSLGGVRLSLAVRATFVGASLNNLVIAQGGEGARVLLVSRACGLTSASVLAALAVDRALDIVSYLALLVGAAWMLELPAHIGRWRSAATVVLALAAMLLVALGVSTGRAPSRTPGTESTSAVRRVADYVRRVGRSGSHVATPARLTGAMLLSLAAWALQVATYHLTAVAAHLTLSWAGSVAAMLAVGISFLVRATPGNVGVFQVIYALTVGSFGIAEGPAVATALLIQALQVVPTVVAGTLLTPGLMRDGQHRANDPRLESR